MRAVENSTLFSLNSVEITNSDLYRAGSDLDYTGVYRVNFGPQHPAAHGVLRLAIAMRGEVVVESEPLIGLLHRGTEKLIEYKTYLQALPYVDRLDYVSMMSQELGYCLGVEALCGLVVPARAIAIRTMFNEMTRILNHLMAITTHALDVGALNPFLWGFEEREKLMEFYERVSGARMHAAYVRPGGVAFDLPLGLIEDILIFCEQFSSRLDELATYLDYNRVWRQRLKGVGAIDADYARECAFTGPVARSAGIPVDLRKLTPYEGYGGMHFAVPLGTTGDSFDRYLIRMEEMRASNEIIWEMAVTMPGGRYSMFEKPAYEENYSMEAVINHFKYYFKSLVPKSAYLYVATEAPKGEFGVSFIADGTNRPYRCKFRTPGFYHLQGLPLMVEGALLADLVTVIGTQDLVFGEIDK